MGIYGEGSFYKTKNSRWVGAIVIDGKRKIVTSKNRAEALRKFKQLKQADTDYSSQEITVKQAIEYYFAHKTLKKSANYHTEKVLELCESIHGKKVSALRLGDLEKIQSLLLSLKYSNTSVNIYMDRLVAILRYVVKKCEINMNNSVFSIEKLPVKNNRESLSIKQIQKLIKHITTRLENNNIDNITLFVCLCIFTGCRKGEILGLRWEDIDFKNKTININKQLSTFPKNNTTGYGKAEHVGGCYFLADLKTNSSYRQIVIADLLYKVLKQTKHNNNNNGLLFDTSFYIKVLPAWKELQKNLGIRRNSDGGLFTVHELRHSTASLMLFMGVSVDVTAKILGHSSVAMTDHYQHLSLELQKEAFSKLNML